MQTTTPLLHDNFQVFPNKIVYNDDSRVAEFGEWSAYLDEVGRLIPFRTGDRDVEIEDGAVVFDWRDQDKREADFDAGDDIVFREFDKLVYEDVQFEGIFHTYDEVVNAPPVRFVIKDFLQADGVTFFGGLPGHGKTLVMLNIAKALLTGESLWEHFEVAEPSNRVIYLIPEIGLSGAKTRLALFGLLPYLKSRKLLIHTLSCREPIALTDPRLLKAAEGADVVLDTAVRFMHGDENSAQDNRDFAQTLFNLQKAGARTVIGAHHSPKAFGNNDAITLESAFRGGGDIGGMLATGWAIKQTDAATNEVYIKNVKARDFQPCAPFQLVGRPYIDAIGAFKMAGMPGLVKAPVNGKRGRPESLNKTDLEWAVAQIKAGSTRKAVASELGVHTRTLNRQIDIRLTGDKSDKNLAD